MEFGFKERVGDVGEAASKVVDRARGAIDPVADVAHSGSAKAAKRVKGMACSVGDAATSAVKGVTGNRGTSQADKEEMVFRNSESLQQVVNVLNEASAALGDRSRTIQESLIPEALMGALGAGVGGVASFGALYGLGVVGLSAAGITSGLATVGAIVGGGMAAGVGVLAAPAVALGIGGYAIASNLKGKQLKQEKERLYKEALSKHQAIIEALREEQDESRERMEYLQSLNVLLERALLDLRKDLGIV